MLSNEFEKDPTALIKAHCEKIGCLNQRYAFNEESGEFNSLCLENVDVVEAFGDGVGCEKAVVLKVDDPFERKVGVTIFKGGRVEVYSA
jgi:hypothetical protein